MNFIYRDRWTKNIVINWFMIIEYFVLGIIIALFLYLFSMTFISFRNESICLRGGFPESVTTWNSVGYCIRTIDQTQYVVPIEELGR